MIPERFTRLETGELFLMHDTGPGPNRILVFTTTTLLGLLSDSPAWCMDGTFNIAPPLFHQLYSIHGTSRGITIPMVFALLPSKTQECYERLFNILKDLQPDLHPRSIMTDFELAVIQAVRTTFQDANISGCFFHLAQCLWRKVQAHGYVDLYREDDGEFATWLRCLPALAFVPEDDVIESFEALTQNDHFTRIVADRAPELVDYYEDTWLGRPHRRRAGGRRAPPFPISLWNVKDRVTQGLGRTNNAVEGWHHKMNKLVGVRAPNLFVLIKDLMKEHELNRNLIEQMIAGHEPPAKKANTSRSTVAFVR